MPSNRWLKPVANSKEQSEQVEPTPNVSMRDVRRLAREKAERQNSEENEGIISDTTVPTTVLTPVSTTVDTTVRTAASKDKGRVAGTPVDTTVGATVPTTVNPTSTDSPAETETGTSLSGEASLPSSSDNLARSAAQPQYLDATHTASEQRVYSLMYRETISKGMRERHYGPKELCAKTGIRSDRTIRLAVRGLVQKFSIEIVSHGAYFPQGPRYRVIEPKEVLRRRRAAGMEIDPQTKKISTPVATTVPTVVPTTVEATVATDVATPVGTVVDGGGKNYRSTPVEITGVTPVEITGVYNKEEKDIGGGDIAANSSSSNKQSASVDDEAFAALNSALRQMTRDVTGREPLPSDAERWRELAELLTTELKIAAARTDSVSNVPAFLTEHLRRRLWKKEKRELEAEASKEAPAKAADASLCPDCGGTGFFYPGGYEGGVARCRHERLTEAK
jgi:hypothetical protein